MFVIMSGMFITFFWSCIIYQMTWLLLCLAYRWCEW
jgi:hypothetical protein